MKSLGELVKSAKEYKPYAKIGHIPYQFVKEERIPLEATVSNFDLVNAPMVVPAFGRLRSIPSQIYPRLELHLGLKLKETEEVHYPALKMSLYYGLAREIYALLKKVHEAKFNGELIIERRVGLPFLSDVVRRINGDLTVGNNVYYTEFFGISETPKLVKIGRKVIKPKL